ncbi:MAG: sigma factor-like helix-turn-helix DNA-binding protein [Candidatus Saccharimonadales bacterium]
MTSEQSELEPQLIERVILSRDQYEPGTYGYELFPEILEGRSRPSDWADQNLYLGEKARDVAASYGVNTAADIMRLPTSTFDEHVRHKHHINKKLNNTLEVITARNVLTPEARLLRATLGAAQGPVEAEDEPLLRSAVTQSIQQLDVQGWKINPRAKKILNLRFGLEDNQPMTLKQVGQELGITRERVRQIESRTLAILRHSSSADTLKPFLTLPLQTVGREMGWTYLKDIPDVPGPMVDYSADLYVARKYSSFHRDPSLKEALSIPLSTINIEDRPEFLATMRRFLQATKQYAIFGDVFDVASGPTSQQATAGARSLPIEQIGLPAGVTYELNRRALRTLGSLLTIRRDATGQIIDYSPPVGQKIHSRVSKMRFILDSMLDSLSQE